MIRTPEFTFVGYKSLIFSLRDNGFELVDYAHKKGNGKKCILRHDVDYDLKKAAEFARFEHDELGVRATYFILVTSPFYNVLTASSRSLIKSIASCGHVIGLHFDETQYACGARNLQLAVEEEAGLLQDVAECEISAVSMHRPSEKTLKADYRFTGMVNSYSKEFFREWTYVSDSRMNWRDNPYDYIARQATTKLHVLTHPFWYSDEPQDMRKTLLDFFGRSLAGLYDSFDDNFSRLGGVLTREEVLVDVNNS